ITVRVAVAIAFGAASTGCAVGPDFKQPAAPTVQGYLPDTLPQQTGSAPGQGGDAQRFVEGMDVPAQWWTVFQSPDLNALIAQAFKNNPTVQGAQAALREANENYYAQRGTLLPTVQGDYSFTRQKNATGTLA